MTDLIQTIETDLKAAWGDLEQAVEAGALSFWDSLKTTIDAVLPEEFTVIETALAGLVTAGFQGSIAEAETALLNLGGQELELVQKLGSPIAQAVIAAINAAEDKLGITKTA